MSVSLLDKTRKLSKLLKTNNSDRASFDDLSKALSELILSDVYFISKSGSILSRSNGYINGKLAKKLEIIEIDNKEIVKKLMEISSTKENIDPQMLGYECEKIKTYGIVSPVEMGKQRLGTILILRHNDPYDIEDIVLAEYVSTIIGIDLYHSIKEDEKDTLRRKQAVKSALDSLSITEQEAARVVFSEVPIEGGMLNTSKLSEKYKITRSLIINCLSKLESAGIIESRSAGAKGTQIKIKNNLIFAEVLKENVDI